MKTSSIKQENKHLLLQWEDQSQSTIPYIWLFDNQPGHRHANGQKLVEVATMDLNVQPFKVEMIGEDLHIQWQEGKTAVYKTEQLKQFATEKTVAPIQFWDNSHILKVDFQWDYGQVKTDKNQMLKFLEMAITYGFALLKGLPTEPEALFEVVKWFGYVRETNYGRYFDVVAKPDPNNLAYTAKGLPPHTDNPYRDPVPTLQLLHCLKADSEGGDSILIDGFKLAEDLKQEFPDYYKVLSEQPILYRFADSETILENRTTVIGLDAAGNYTHIRFNNRSIQPFDFEGERLLKYYAAYQAFEKLMHKEKYVLQFKLEPGNLILFDNERILHGRTAYTLTGERHLQGCYSDRDGLRSKWKVLKNSK